MENSINIPTSYKIDLPTENELYYNDNHKPQIKQPLFDASQGYCMYCGKRMVIETDVGAQLEHSVDKKGNIGQEASDKDKRWRYLRHCKHNFALSCPTCNMVCKKHIEKIDLTQYPVTITCKTTDCNENYCDTYRDLRRDYIKRNAIILQPNGIETDYIKYGISYDLIKHIYVPSPTSIDISKENCEEYGYEYNKALFYIQNHIDRFCLNGKRFSECIIDICSDIVFLWENGFSEISAFWDYYQDKVLDNIIGSLFVEYLKEHFNDLSKMIEYCRLIVLLYSIC